MTVENCKVIIDKIDEWSKRWKLDFNANKCHVMELGKRKKKAKMEQQEEILKTKEEKRSRRGDTRYTEPRTAYKSNIWIHIHNINQH